MAETFILFFHEASLGDLELLGGKGANLAELQGAGFPVPTGFGVTSAAFEYFLARNQLDTKLRQFAAATDFSDRARVADMTTAVRQLIRDAPLPPRLADAITEAYRAMPDGQGVAVRSSSMVPGIGKSSFPGQMDTYYDVEGSSDLLLAVKKVWASLWNLRATLDRWNKGIDHFAVKVSALVQQMVPAEFSGVCFTANPVTGDDEYVIEAVAGLGEALVSGKVTPDRFRLTKDTLAFREKTAGSALPDALVKEVADLCGRIETHYGRPQDVEWAWAGRQLHALQSRDIAGPVVEPANHEGLERWNKPPEADEERIIWTRAWSDEVLTRALTPLFYSVQADLITTTYDFIYRCYGLNELLPLRIMRFHKNRGYFSTRYLMACLRYVPKSARDAEVLKFFAPGQIEKARTMPFSIWRRLYSEIRLAVLYRKYSFTRCHRTYSEGWRPELLRRVEELDDLDLDTASTEQLETYFWGMDKLIKEHCRPIGFGVMVHTATAISLLTKALERWTNEGENVGTLLSGVPGNFTVATNEATWRLSREIVAAPHLLEVFTTRATSDIARALEATATGRRFLARMEAFRREFAFRGAEDRDISFPRWGDSPELLLDILRIFVLARDQADPGAVERSNIAARERTTRVLLKSLRAQRWGRFKRWAVARLLHYAQVYSLFRENQRYDVDRVFYGQRKAFLAIAVRLAESGTIAVPEDIWFLSKEEVFDALNGTLSHPEVAQLIAPRKAEFRRYQHRPPPMFLQGEREWEDAAESSGNITTSGEVLLRGVAASPGTASGIARVVRDLSDISRVEPGDILVTNSTDPGWTPVFLLISGVVLETGGILAHGTVLSREYGLPAVTSVSNATHLIRDGARICIDGSSGTIRCDEDATTGDGASEQGPLR